MKEILFSIIMTFIFLNFTTAQKSLNTNSEIQTNPQPNPVEKPVVKPAVRMQFDSEMIDLGKVKRGDKKEFDFCFTNTGTETLEIEIVSGCECSTLDWTYKPIPPGEKGYINVIFDSTEKEASEVVDIDMTLKNIDPKTGYQIFKIVNFKFELIQ